MLLTGRSLAAPRYKHLNSSTLAGNRFVAIAIPFNVLLSRNGGYLLSRNGGYILSRN